MCESVKMYMKNKGTYFNLNKWIFVLQFIVLSYRYLKGMFNNYFRVGSDNYFPLTSVQ
jgi:hypothetical protein